MTAFVDQSGHWDVTRLALVAILVSIAVMAFVVSRWKAANARVDNLQKEIASRKVLLADTGDRLLMEEQTSAELRRSLNQADNIIAKNQYDLVAAREKISSLNSENDAIYSLYLLAERDLKGSGVALHYWQYLAKRILHNSCSHLERVAPLLREAVKLPGGAQLVPTVEPVECALELLDLAAAGDVPQRIRDMRADGTRTVIHLIPRLQRLVEEWERTLGPRFAARVPLMDKPSLFAGSWAHLELVLTTMVSNAVKHSVASSLIEFEFSSADRMVTFQVSNRSSVPIPENVIRAKNEMVVGDLERPRFGLFLIDQIASGYRAIVKVENVGAAADAESHVVRTSFSFALR